MENQSSLREVKIVRLFGKYDFSIKLERLVNILVAENGSGKTTVLNIITSVLKQDLNNLSKYPFEKVILKFNDSSQICIEKSELDYLIEADLKFFLDRFAHYLPRREYVRLKSTKYLDEQTIDNLLKMIPLSRKNEFIETLNIIKHKYLHENENDIKKGLGKKLNSISTKLNSEVLYLPTYRRIEEELENLGLSEERTLDLSSKMINFGMNDVEQKLKELTEKIKKEAMIEYSKMSKEILDDLINEKINLKNYEAKKINKEILSIILGRIGEEHIQHNEKIVSLLDSSGKNNFTGNFLKYYLVKLINIYESQKEIDEKIKGFKNICNGYLVNKKIVYDEVLAEVTIRDNITNKILRFSNLSSGEKQIISLFAKLYLEDKKDLILIIDEPELSLSLIWQRRLLPDIINSGKCDVLLATTHSPFIYDNEFKYCADDLASLLQDNFGGENE